jgi:hypothetical protein
MALDIVETELLPSDVIKVKFYRPPNFKYLSGQWVRLSCTAFQTEEFHSFTLTSAPHENFLSCHIKAQGPWTWKLRNYFDPCNYNPEEDHPKVSCFTEWHHKVYQTKILMLKSIFGCNAEWLISFVTNINLLSCGTCGGGGGGR